MRTILLGLPGAGKGTQAALLAEAHGVPHIATGNIFRQAVAAGTDVGRQVAAILEQGGLVPDALTLAVVRERLAEADCRAGFVLDGFPRTLVQGEALDALLAGAGTPVERAIYLEVPEERAVARLSGRRSCPGCGATYHTDTDPPASGGLCRRCGQAVVARADDEPAVVRRRIAAYRRDTEPLLAYFRGQGRLAVVDGDRPAAEVAADMRRAAEVQS